MALIRLLRKRSLRHLLKFARSARAVRQSNHPFQNLEICTALEQINPGIPQNAFDRLGRFAPAAAQCVRQRLVATVTYPRLLPQVLLLVAGRKESVAVTAPRLWREALHNQGYRVSRPSFLQWWLQLGLLYAQGVKASLSRVAAILAGNMPPPAREEYAVLMHLTPNMTPRSNGLGFDFVSWYVQSTDRDSRIRSFWAHVAGRQAHSGLPSITITTQYLPRLDSFSLGFRVIAAICSNLVASTIRGLAGQWWEIVLLEQLTDFVYARHMSRRDFARAYVFNNARFIMRPLWTYVAEQAGATIDLAFYSTNVETFGRTPLQARPFWPGYRGMSWQRYIVWDETHARFIRALGIPAPAIISRTPGFVDSPAVVPVPPKPYIVVFDVTPQRLVSLAVRGIPHPYYTDEVWWKFITHIESALDSHGFHMVYKKKREIGRVASRGFRTVGSRWLSEKNVVIVDPDVAPPRLIGEAAGVISMPFTSTGIIAAAMGKPAIYYDPLGVLTHEQALAHGIDVIGNPKDLSHWVAQVKRANLVKETVS
jgi:polysaccharide biosynthesis PFTS motif protein